jgi:CIC family chloride channel protein
VFKVLAMDLTISSGGSGGVFGPNVYIGAMLGGWVAFVVDKWFPAAQLVPAAFMVVGMGAVFAGTARVPLATLIMVAEMTGGYGLIVPSMLAASLSFLVQRTLTAHARYPRLYEAQVEDRPDSPVHHLDVVQGAFRLLEAQDLQHLRGVSLPDLGKLLHLGQAIAIHGGKGRIFTFHLEPSDGLVGRKASEAFGPLDGLVLVAVVRHNEVLPPGGLGSLQAEDQLILAAGDQAHRDFLQAHRPTILPGTE